MTSGWIINLLISAAAADRRLHFWLLEYYSSYRRVVIHADGGGEMEVAEYQLEFNSIQRQIEVFSTGHWRNTPLGFRQWQW